MRFDSTTNTLHLSAIFAWYRDDFEKGPYSAGYDSELSLKEFILLYADPELSRRLGTNSTVKTDFLEYDSTICAG